MASKGYITSACKDSMESYINALDFVLDDAETIKAVQQSLKNASKYKQAMDIGLAATINGYLSGLATLSANMISPFVQGVLRPLTVAVGAATDKLGMTKGDRGLRDAVAMVQAQLESFGADLIFFKAGFRSGKPLDIRTTVNALANTQNISVIEARQKIIDSAARAFADAEIAKGSTQSAEELAAVFKGKPKEKLDELIESFLGENYDYITSNVKGLGFINYPTKAIVAIDEYSKARFRRMKIAELASRKARKDADAGKGKYADLFDEYKKQSLVINDFPQNTSYKEIQKSLTSLEKNLGRVFGSSEDDMIPYETVKEFALDQTFQSRLHGILDSISRARHNGTPLGAAFTFYVPFIKSPWNIIKEGTTYVPVLPVIARPKYVKFGENKPIPMTKDELIPRQIIGGSMFLGVMAMYDAGRITGAPRNAQEAQEWKDKGIQPQSIKIGDTWISYARVEPIATVFGIAAELKRSWDEYQEDPRPSEDKDLFGETTIALLTGLKTHILQKSFVEGLAKMFDFASDPVSTGSSFVSQTLRPLTPAIVNQAARLLDTSERQATTQLEKIQQRIPILREQLPKDYGSYGGARERNLSQTLTGMGAVKDSERTELQREVEYTGVKISRPQKKLKSVELTNDQLADYRELSSDLTTKYLNSVIKSRNYQNATKSQKRRYLEIMSSKARSKAREVFAAQLAKTDPEFARKFNNEEIIRLGLEDRIELKSPSQ